MVGIIVKLGEFPAATSLKALVEFSEVTCFGVESIEAPHT
jgi:hypothetical protein